jgi:hypothetical protein
MQVYIRTSMGPVCQVHREARLIVSGRGVLLIWYLLVPLADTRIEILPFPSKPFIPTTPSSHTSLPQLCIQLILSHLAPRRPCPTLCPDHRYPRSTFLPTSSSCTSCRRPILVTSLPPPSTKQETMAPPLAVPLAADFALPPASSTTAPKVTGGLELHGTL